jgi:hypothetical protein
MNNSEPGKSDKYLVICNRFFWKIQGLSLDNPYMEWVLVRRLGSHESRYFTNQDMIYHGTNV